MKRLLASALIVGVSTFGVVGCEQKTETKNVSETKTPDGTKKVTDTQTTEATGSVRH